MTAGTLTWADGDGADKYLEIPIVNDLAYRGNREFWVQLSGAVGATCGGLNLVSVTILDDEPPSAVAEEVFVWVEDRLPAGAAAGGTGGEAWNWDAINPSPYQGVLAHRSISSDGWHQHYFYNATETMTVNPEESLFAYIYLDAANPPGEVLLQWIDGDDWAHMASWGADLFQPGAKGPSNYYGGPLPAAGQWARLEVPAAAAGLEGRILDGMSFILWGGQATWDHVGKASGALSPGGTAAADLAAADRQSRVWAGRFESSQVTLVLETGGAGKKQVALPLRGQPATRQVLEASSNLVDWSVIGVSAGEAAVFHLQGTNAATTPQRFFRLAPAEEHQR
jgi:hypothetical protein